jgi:hypothetical protein
MRANLSAANLCAALCAGVLAGYAAGPANAADYVTGYGWYGGGCCYRAPVALPYEAYADEAYTPPAVYYRQADYYRPAERRQLVRPYEYSHSGWDVYATYGLDAYAAADTPDDACALIRLADWRGGWAWTRRAGCF